MVTMTYAPSTQTGFGFDLVQQHEAAERSKAFLGLAVAKGLARSPGEIYPIAASLGIRASAIKSAVDTLGAADGPGALRPLASAFLAQVDRVSVLGRLPGRRVPTAITGRALVSLPQAHWVGENDPIPASEMEAAALVLEPFKLGSLVICTRDLIRYAGPLALNFLQRALVGAIVKTQDETFLDPSNTGEADVRPASITSGGTSITPTASLVNDIGSLLAALSDGQPSRPFLIASHSRAIRLQAAVTGLSEIVPVLISPGAGSTVVALDADGLLFSDGGIEVDSSTQALVDADSAPDGSSIRNLFADNLLSIRSLRFVNWRARPGSVAHLTLS
jgi:hypothetical protein